jgi:hypothetical protein
VGEAATPTLPSVGARGIKRRKPKRELHDFTDHLAPGDERRVFGRFENSTFSPMGNVERSWFFGRQLARGDDGRAFRNALRMLWLSLPIIAALVLAIMLLAFVVQHA